MNISDISLRETLEKYKERKQECEAYQSGKTDTERSIKDMLETKSIEKPLVDKAYGLAKYLYKKDIPLADAQEILRELYELM